MRERPGKVDYLEAYGVGVAGDIKVIWSREGVNGLGPNQIGRFETFAPDYPTGQLLGQDDGPAGF